MPIRMDIEFDDSEIYKLAKQMESKGEKCINKATWDATKHGKAVLFKEAEKEYNIKKQEYFKYLKLEKPGSIVVTSTKGMVPSSGKGGHFNLLPAVPPSQEKVKVRERKQASAKIKHESGREKMAHAFILPKSKLKNMEDRDGYMLMEHGDNMSSKIREGHKKREPVVRSFETTNAAFMAGHGSMPEKTLDKMAEQAEKRLQYYIDKEMDKIANH